MSKGITVPMYPIRAPQENTTKPMSVSGPEKTAAAHAVYMGNTWATSVKATECSYTTSHGIPIPWHSRFIHNTLNS